ncbi:MAG: hypothetical protein ACOYVK_01695 [Bacillota bacterium]
MKISGLSDDTRLELHNYVKRLIRKYYKGLKNGSLRCDIFVEKMLASKTQPSWLKENPHLLQDEEFKESLILYIRNALEKYVQLEKQNRYQQNQKSNILNKDKHITNKENTPITIIQKQELKQVLKSRGFSLSIPMEFLTSLEATYLKDYVLNGTSVPVGWEKVLNYIKKST